MSRKDWLAEHWEAEDRLWTRFKDQSLDRYFAYLAEEGRRIAEELKLPTGDPSAGDEKSSGYRVLTAREGEEALRLVRRESEPLHLLLTDLVLPGINGKEVAKRVMALSPQTKVLYMSGYTNDVVVHHGHLDPGVDLLQKPISMNALGRKVREILDRAV